MLHVRLSSLCWSSKDVTCYIKFLVDRVKMLHVTSWDMAGVRTDAQQWQWRWVQKKHLFQATGRQLHKEAFGWKRSGKKTLISKACIYQNEKAQNPGLRHLEKGIWPNSLQIWSCNSNGPAKTKYTCECKLRSEPPGTDVYVCMYVCMHACMDGWMDGCMYVCMYVCIWRCNKLQAHHHFVMLQQGYLQTASRL